MTNLISQLKDLRTNRDPEDGFTLIELMIVVVIIGILAAIAIPIFMNQQKAAVAATLKSDVKNTADNVGLALTKTPTSADLTGTTKTVTDGNTVTVTGSWQDYTVKAENTNASPNCFEFKSLTGKITECEATDTPGGDEGGDEEPIPSADTCVAYGYDGQPLSDCSISSIRFDELSSPSGVKTRNYFISFNTVNAMSVSFDVDLAQATGSGGSWDWTNAGIEGATPAQFRSIACSFPRVSGVSNDWQTSTVYLSVSEQTPANNMCA